MRLCRIISLGHECTEPVGAPNLVGRHVYKCDPKRSPRQHPFFFFSNKLVQESYNVCSYFDSNVLDVDGCTCCVSVLILSQCSSFPFGLM